MMMCRTTKAFLYRQRQHAGLGIEVDVLDVRRNLTAVSDSLVVVIDLEHVFAERVRVEDLTDGKVHQRGERVARDLLIARQIRSS